MERADTHSYSDISKHSVVRVIVFISMCPHRNESHSGNLVWIKINIMSAEVGDGLKRAFGLHSYLRTECLGTKSKAVSLTHTYSFSDISVNDGDDHCFTVLSLVQKQR